jgi:hypothetical protein
MDNDLAEHIKRIENDLIAFKTAQPIGTDSVLTFSTQTNNIWDYSVVGVDSPATFVRLFVRMVAHNQDAPFGRIRFFAECDGVNFDYKTPESWRLTNKGPFVWASDDFFYATSNEMNNPKLLRFMIEMSVPLGKTLNVKYVIDATDTGRVYHYTA